MKTVRTIVVFDQGGMTEGQEWAKMHESYTRAVQEIVHPSGQKRFVLRRKSRKPDAHGNPSKHWFRNGVVPIKERFIANLLKQGWRAEMPVGLYREALEEAGPETKTALVEYPSKQVFAFDDANWSQVFREGLGDF